MTTSFNSTKDQIGWYVADAAATAAEIGLLLLSTAEADASLADRTTVAAVVGAPNGEATFTNYVRKTLSTPTRTVDNTLDRVLLGGAAPGTSVQITWTAAGGGTNNTLVKVVFYYQPASGATDTTRLPLMATDISAMTDGNDLVLTLHADGFARVVNP